MNGTWIMHITRTAAVVFCAIIIFGRCASTPKNASKGYSAAVGETAARAV